MQPLYARSFPVIKPLVKQGGSKQKVRRGDAVRMMGKQGGSMIGKWQTPGAWGNMGSGKKSMRSKHIIRRS